MKRKRGNSNAKGRVFTVRTVAALSRRVSGLVKWARGVGTVPSSPTVRTVARPSRPSRLLHTIRTAVSARLSGKTLGHVPGVVSGYPPMLRGVL